MTITRWCQYCENQAVCIWLPNGHVLPLNRLTLNTVYGNAHEFMCGFCAPLHPCCHMLGMTCDEAKLFEALVG